MTGKLNLQALYFSERLADDLENIKKYPLTVLEAPSGFGKTTALLNFFSQEYFDDVCVMKRTFFAGGADEYWRWLCTFFESFDVLSAEALRNCGTPCSENMADIREIMSDLECADETYIVLDNLSGSCKGMKAFLTALSFHSTKKLHIVASVQSASAKNSFRFQGGGNVYCIGTKDFSFTCEDCRKYFFAAGIVLTYAEISELMKITDGWIFAIYLQLLFYAKNQRFEKGILSTLIEKAFFDRLSDDERRFYVSLSPFESFTQSMAAFVSGKDADFVSAHLYEGGFIHYDGKRQEYYFHNLLYEYLGTVFAKLTDVKKNAIYEKGAQWEAENGKKNKSIMLYYKAGAYEKIFNIPHTSYELADIEDENTRIMIFDILDKTPHEVKLRYLENMVPLAFILFFVGENEKLGETIGEILELAQQSNLPSEKKNAILGETELLISFTKYNDIAQMSYHHRKAYELLGKRASLINMRSTWSFGSPSVMCLYHSKVGALKRELELMDECMPYYYRLTGGHGNGSEYAMRAEAEFLRGNSENAETLAHRAMFEAQNKNQANIYQCGLFVLANTALQKGDENKLFEVLVAMSESAVSNTEDMCRYTQSMFLGYIYAFSHRPDKVDEWLAGGDIGDNRIAPMTIPFAHIVYAKVLLERGEYSKLLAFCPFACSVASMFPTVLPQIYFNIFASCAHLARGDRASAEKALDTALSAAAPDKIFMPFAQNYSYIKPILKGEYSDEIRHLGVNFERAIAKMGTDKPPLTLREREVAELIRQGLTNKQIAARLYISISTVKMTISNIFDKTGVKSRAQL